MFRTGSHRSLRHDVTLFLDELGSTSAEVAARLADDGIRGVPGSTDSCAIAVYLHAVLGADDRVRDIHVSNGWVTVSRRWGPGVLASQPNPVRAFIRMFDAGLFPELVRSGGAPTSPSPGGAGPGSAAAPAASGAASEPASPVTT